MYVVTPNLNVTVQLENDQYISYVYFYLYFFNSTGYLTICPKFLLWSVLKSVYRMSAFIFLAYTNLQTPFLVVYYILTNMTYILYMF